MAARVPLCRGVLRVNSRGKANEDITRSVMAEAQSKISFFSIERLKKRIPYFLFFVGLMIGLGVFIGDHADEMPWTLKYIAPAYYREEKGIEALKIGKTLNQVTKVFQRYLAL
jgi:hypothetical protein